jgi:hypothetical protein
VRNSSKMGYAAMAVALVALVASMAGAGYAAAKIHGNQIKKGTITSKQIKNGKVKAKDIAPGVITPPAARTFSDSASIQVGANPTTFVTVGTLSGLAAGDYAISGKANVEANPLGGSDSAQVICALFVNGVEVDRSLVQIGENAATTPVVLRSALPVQAVAAVPANGTVTLGCAKGGANIDIDAAHRKLSVVAVDLP